MKIVSYKKELIYYQAQVGIFFMYLICRKTGLLQEEANSK